MQSYRAQRTRRGSLDFLKRGTTRKRSAASLESRQPSGRLIEASEVAHAIAYLLDSRSSSTTGEVLHVDAGLTRLRVPTGTQRAPR